MSPEADDDYRGILAYTLRTWGEAQMEKYDTLLDTALLTIEDDPRQGRRHPKLPANYRYYHAGRHYIVYRIEGEQLEVVRILHDQMDITPHIH
jgi:toxin ParE1/3/4